MSQRDYEQEEDYDESPQKARHTAKSKGKPKRDAKDQLITRLNNVNFKLRQHLKELNNKLDVAIENSYIVKKAPMPSKEIKPEEEAMRVDNIKKCIENIKTS
jgi:hypothetical protein